MVNGAAQREQSRRRRGAVGFNYLITKKGDSHVVAGATPMIVSGKIEGRLPGNHRDVMTILMIVAIDELVLSVRNESPFKVIDDFGKRMPDAADVPTFAEMGYEFLDCAWTAPADRPIDNAIPNPTTTSSATFIDILMRECSICLGLLRMKIKRPFPLVRAVLHPGHRVVIRTGARR